MVHRNATLLHDFFEVSVAQAVGRIPADTHKNDFLWKPHSLQLKHHVWSIDLQASSIIAFALDSSNATQPGAVRLKDFEGKAYEEPSVRRILAMTTAQAHPDMADDAAEQWGAEVIVTLKDGRKLSRRVNNLVGRGDDNPMTRDELWEKFNNCAERSLPDGQIELLFERLQQLDGVPDIKQVTALLMAS